ncbi:hypothetical protein ACWXWU_05265 [Shewanella sp. A14]
MFKKIILSTYHPFLLANDDYLRKDLIHYPDLSVYSGVEFTVINRRRLERAITKFYAQEINNASVGCLDIYEWGESRLLVDIVPDASFVINHGAVFSGMSCEYSF